VATIYDGLTTVAEREAAYDKFVYGNLRRNYAGHFVHGMLGMTGFRLVNAPTFMPAYLHVICGAPWLVGLGLSLQQLGGMLSSLVGATLIEHRIKVLPVSMFLGTMMRVWILGLGVAGFFLTGNWLVAVVMFCLFMLGLFSGPQGVAFQYLLAKVIPIRLRGRLQGYRNVTGGLIAALLSYFAGKYLVGGNAFGNGYGVTYLLAFVLTSLGLTFFRFLLQEPEPPTIRPKTRLLDRFREMPEMLRSDRGFMYFMITRTFAIAGRVAAPFYILYAGKAIHLSGEFIGELSFCYLIADTVTNLGWGYMADKQGFRSTFVGALIFYIAGTALLMSVHTVPTFMIAFFALGAANSGYQMSAQNIVFEFGHRDDMAMRLALSNTAESIMTTIGPLAVGAIAVAFGYPTIFVLSMMLEAVALVLLLTLVREPRHIHIDPVEAAAFDEN